jgi:amino acid adenylation domain-containing protein
MNPSDTLELLPRAGHAPATQGPAAPPSPRENGQAQPDGALPGLPVPADRPAAPRRTFRAARLPLALPAWTAAGLRELGAGAGAAPFAGAVAALQALVHRCTGQDEVVLGWAGPTGEAPARPLQGDCSGDPTFLELLRRTAEAVQAADADPGPPAGLPVVVAFRTAGSAGPEGPGLPAHAVGSGNGVPPPALRWEFVDGGRRLEGAVEYDADLFDEPTVARLVGHYRTLATAAVAAPGRRVSELPLLTEAEKHRLVEEWNRHPPIPAEGEALLHRLVEGRAGRSPDAVAFTCGDEHLTYAALDARATRLARRLAAAGVRPGDTVGLYLERSLALPVALLGTLKAGAACLPLDPEDPPDRIAAIRTDARPVALLTDRGRAPEAGPAVPVLDPDGDGPPPTDRRPADRSADGRRGTPGATDPDAPAFVFYTSGSTGRPKGVVLSHRTCCIGQRWLQSAFGGSPADVHLLRTSISVTNLVREAFWPCLGGGRSVIARPGGHKDVPYLARLIAEQQVTLLLAVPTMLEAFLETPGFAGCASLRLVFSSSDLMAADLPRRYFTSGPPSAFGNLYGLTEALYVAYWDCRNENPRPVVPIGRSAADVRVYLLDRRLQPVPVGVPGELFIGGEGVASGYLNRPELTAEKFVPDPFAPTPGACCYRTGDLARYRANGDVELLGRLDHQAKVRGYRVELGEVEATLARHPGLKEVVALVREVAPGDRRLVAYVVASGDRAPDVSELHRFVRDRLPEYMIPSAFVVLPALPLTHNGKVDRKALPAPDQVRPELAEAYVPPRNRTETVLAGLWGETLGLDRVGVNDNFFELGGDSIQAIRISSRAATVGLEVAPNQFFETPTVAEIAAGARTREVTVTAGAAPVPRRDPGPGGFTPADFADFAWTDTDLDTILAAIRRSLDGAENGQGQAPAAPR